MRPELDQVACRQGVFGRADHNHNVARTSCSDACARAPPHSASTLGWPLSTGGCVARRDPGPQGLSASVRACVRAAVHGLGWQTCPRRQMRQQREARADRAVHGCTGVPLRLRSLRRVHCDVPEEGRGAPPTASLPPARPHGVVCARSPLLPPFPSLPDRVLCSRLRAPPRGGTVLHAAGCCRMLSAWRLLCSGAAGPRKPRRLQRAVQRAGLRRVLRPQGCRQDRGGACTRLLPPRAVHAPLRPRLLPWRNPSNNRALVRD